MLSVEPCFECLGSGRSVSAHCPGCNGVGDVWTQRRIEVRIPSGVENGRWIRLAHAAGSVDAYVRVKVLPPPRDPAWIRIGALAALLVAVAFLVYLLLN